MASGTIDKTKCLQPLYTKDLTIKIHRFWVHHIEHPNSEVFDYDAKVRNSSENTEDLGLFRYESMRGWYKPI